MPSRRRFLQASLGAPLLSRSALALRPADAVVGETPPRAGASMYRVVYDERFAVSVEFGRIAAGRGIELVGIDGDITDFWFHDLSQQWKQRPAPIAGLTAHGPLFCLERLAWDHGLRVVFRGEHRFEGQRAMHAISGTSPAVRAIVQSALASPGWMHHVARALTRHDPSATSTGLARITAGGICKHGAGEPLVSWLIARAGEQPADARRRS